MGSNLDANEILGFLRDYRNREGPDHGQSPYFGYHDPRWAPPVAHHQPADLLASSEYYLNLDAADDGQSEHTTTASTVTSPTFTTATRSRQSASLFSARGSSSAGSRSTAPPRGHPRQTFEQQFAGGGPFFVTPTTPAHASNHNNNNHNNTTTGGGGGGQHRDHLWCEFSELQRCGATFRADDEAGWIAHHAAHLGGTFPRKLMCWFCDDDHHAPFVVVKDRDCSTTAAEAEAEARYANFELRMRHVREHILGDGRRRTPDDVRPDFFVVEHLGRRGLLDEDTYRHAMAFSEMPDKYRLPGSGSGSGDGGGEKLRRQQQQQRAAREKGEYHDLEREKRRYHKEERERRGGKLGGGGGSRRNRHG